MANYKITNVTNTAGKRDIKFNTTLDIQYVDGMTKKSLKVKPGETVFLQIHSLPLSVHQLRVKKLIIVSEISANELRDNINAGKPKVVQPIVKTAEETEKESVAAKKKSKKVHEE
jgi:hypothetical protein